MQTDNLAYDLSIYEVDEERHIARKEKKANRVIKAHTKFNIGRNIIKVVGIALTLSLIIGVIATNAAITSYTSKIASVNNEIVQLESEQAYLEFTLESRMSLDEIENYATGTLGMVKMESSQKKYVELESENKLVLSTSPVKEKLAAAVQPVMSYLLP